MSIIVKKKGTPDASKPAHQNDKTSEGPEEPTEITLNRRGLTPWQQENLKYHEEKGDTPSWTPVVLGKEEENQGTIPESPEDNEAEEKESEETVMEPENSEKQPETQGPVNGSFADRLPNLKQQRKRLLIRRLSFLITLFTIPLLFFLYNISPFSKLQEIAVTGNQAVDSEVIKEASGLILKENIWSQYFERERGAENIEKLIPRVKTSKVSLAGPTKMTITVSEYAEAAVLSADDGYHAVLENGTILADVLESKDDNYPLLENFDDESYIRSLLPAYTELTDSTKELVKTIKYAPSNANQELLKIDMKDGNQVIVGIYNLVEQMAYYPKVVSEMQAQGMDKGIIDMEVGIYSYEYPTESGSETKQE